MNGSSEGITFVFYRKQLMETPFDLSKPIGIGGDHAGFGYKQQIIQWLNGKGYLVSDYGTFSADSVDYPDYAHPTASAVEKGEVAFGILLCGSANGVAMTANKHAGVRAGLCWTGEIVDLARKHNDANILCIPTRFTAVEQAIAMVEIFMQTAFEGGRHITRVGKIGC
jgi:ribose 5-phosphate isomerase B